MAPPKITVRGIRGSVPAGYIIGRAPGGNPGAAQLISIADLTRQILPISVNGTSGGGGSSLPTLASGHLLANSGASSATAADTTLTALLDRVYGSTRGQIIYRGASAWVALAIGSTNQILQSNTDPAWIGLSSLIDTVIGGTQGDIAYRNGTVWTALAPGTSGQFLKTQGASANPIWASVSLAGLSDVTLTTLAANNLLYYNSVASKWENESISDLLDSMLGSAQGQLALRGASGWTVLPVGTSGQFLKTLGSGADPVWASVPAGSLAGLTDVVLTSVANGDVLTYDTGTSKWINAAPSGGGGSSTLAGLTDVLLSGLANNNILYYNSGASKWENEGLSALLDAVLGSTQGDIVYRNATTWTVLAPGTSGYLLKTGGSGANPSWTAPPSTTFYGLSDVSDPTPAAGDIFYGASGPTVDALAVGLRGQCLVVNSSVNGPVWRNHQANQSWKAPVAWGTTAALPSCTYANGSSGIGATLTASANGALTIDGRTILVTDTVLVKNQAAALQNGIYTCTQAGDSTHPFILTRRDDFDHVENCNTGMTVTILFGNTLANTIWASQSVNLPVLGTDAINWAVVVGSVLSGTVGPGSFLISGVATDDILSYDSGSSAFVNIRPRYNIGVAVMSGIPTSNQLLLLHKFPVGVTIPANFGAYHNWTSEAGGSATATGSYAISVDKALAATPTTFSNIGTITFAAGSAVGTFTTTSGAAKTFAAGDVLRIVAPSGVDATFSNFFATIVGYET